VKERSCCRAGQQIAAWGLPTRPTKKTDSRSKSFKGENVEVDAIEPSRLHQIVRECIEKQVDQRALAVLRAAERARALFANDRTSWRRRDNAMIRSIAAMLATRATKGRRVAVSQELFGLCPRSD
jgi:erythromycin esterase-like protein